MKLVRSLGAAAPLVILILLTIRSRAGGLTCPNSTPTPTPTPPTGNGVTVKLNQAKVATTDPEWSGGENNNYGGCQPAGPPGVGGFPTCPMSSIASNNTTVAQTLVNHGIHSTLSTAYFGNLFRSTSITETSYRTAMTAAGCSNTNQPTGTCNCTGAAGSATGDCNPANWNWAGSLDNTSTTGGVDAAPAQDAFYGQTYKADGVGQIQAWEPMDGYLFTFASNPGAGEACNSASGTTHPPTCYPSDWGEFEDIIMKMYQHGVANWGGVPTWIQIGQEPDSCGGILCMPAGVPALYITYYYHMAHAFKTMNPNVLTGGPVENGQFNQQQLLASMQTVKTSDGLGPIPTNWVNVVAWHNYDTAQLDVPSWVSIAKAAYPNALLAETEWNYAPGNGGVNDNNTDPGFYGSRLLQFIGNGTKSDIYHHFWQFGDDLYSFQPGTYTMFQKAWANYLFWHDIGIHGGDSVMPSTPTNISVGYGGMTAAGHPWAGIGTSGLSAQNVTAAFQGLTPNHTYSATVYLVDSTGNGSDNHSGQGFYAAGNVVSDANGNGSFTWSQPGSGIAGIILQ